MISSLFPRTIILNEQHISMMSSHCSLSVLVIDLIQESEKKAHH